MTIKKKFSFALLALFFCQMAHATMFTICQCSDVDENGKSGEKLFLQGVALVKHDDGSVSETHQNLWSTADDAGGGLECGDVMTDYANLGICPKLPWM